MSQPPAAGADNTHHFTHVFAPYISNDEYRLVQHTWQLAADEAWRSRRLRIDHICLVPNLTPSTTLLLCPPFARPMLFTRGLPNYKKSTSSSVLPVPSYGEVFRLAKVHGRGKYVMYSNSDIALAPGFFSKVWDELEFDYTARDVQLALLQRTRSEFYRECMHSGDSQEEEARRLCLLDAIVVFGNMGGRVPVDNLDYAQQVLDDDGSGRPIDVDRLYRTTSQRQKCKDDDDLDGNALIITRAQFATSNATELLLSSTDGLFVVSGFNQARLEELFARAEHHPGNDLFIVRRSAISAALQSTPFTHLRPAGLLLPDLLTTSNTLLRRVQSTALHPLTFHVGRGTDEFRARAAVQPRQVLFEAAHFFRRTGSARRKLLLLTEHKASPCHKYKYYRKYGTGALCSRAPELCRGSVRWACTAYMSRASREALAYRKICRKLATGSSSLVLPEPFCSLCNVLEEAAANAQQGGGDNGTVSYTCRGLAKECATFPCGEAVDPIVAVVQ